jgi:hypothetical protein
MLFYLTFYNFFIFSVLELFGTVNAVMLLRTELIKYVLGSVDQAR